MASKRSLNVKKEAGFKTIPSSGCCYSYATVNYWPVVPQADYSALDAFCLFFGY